MTVTRADFDRMQADRKGASMLRDQAQLTASRVAGAGMEALQNEPSWKLYLDHVEALKVPAEKHLESLKKQLLEEEDSKVRRDYIRTLGYVEGLTNAVLCGRTVIQQGKIAKDKLAEEAAADVRRDQEEG